MLLHHAVRLFLICGAFVCANLGAQELRPRPAWSTSRISGSPIAPEPYRIEPAFPYIQFSNPTSLLEIPGSDRMLVTQIDGKVFTFSKNKNVQSTNMAADLAEIAGGAVSLFHATLHPDSHRFLFVCYVRGSETRVSRFVLNDQSPPKIIANSEQLVITWPSGGHNAGCLQFGKDGYLYIATGDGSGPNPPDGLTTGQTVDDLLGAILRIDVNHLSKNKPYDIPPDNPFVSLAGARPEIWAYGLRNPWKFGVDAKTGNIFAADNGWETWEMIHRIVRGGNCGWPVMEGRAALRSEVQVGPTPIQPPVKDHHHSEANSVIGGPVYRGAKIKELDGFFIYGDYITGTIWALRAEPDGSYTHSTLVDTDQRITAFSVGSQGELYMLDYDFTGKIYEILPNPTKDTSAEFPRKLSDTGLFASIDDLTPAAGVIPYQVKVDRWTDGAEATRWIAIPGKGKVMLSADIRLPSEFPDGTVLVKNLTIESQNESTRRLETQLLHLEAGKWSPYSYAWDDDGQDATLVSAIGANIPIVAKSHGTELLSRTWRVSAHNECRLCHNAGSHFVLGFSANQLDRIVSFDGAENNQLKTLQEQNVIGRIPEIDHTWNLVDPHDDSASIDDRARSYLHANCGMCHHPRGNAIVSFHLARNLTFEQLQTNKGTGIGTFGLQNAKLIVPGDPYRSVLFYRFSKLGYGRMPYIGSQLVDSRGVAILDQWIRSLPGDAVPSPPLNRGSKDSQSIRDISSRSAFGSAKQTAIDQLLKTTEGALALTSQMHREKIHSDDFQMVADRAKNTKADICGLFDTFVPEAARRVRLGPQVDPQTLLTKKGDLARGRLIYSSDGARCKNCHDAHDASKSLGPTIVEINKKYPRRSELIGHILNPSQKIDDAFATHSVVTSDGKVISGLMIKNTKDSMVVKTLENKTISISRPEIEEINKSERSLMPERLLSDLTAQEAADLIEFFQSIR